MDTFAICKHMCWYTYHLSVLQTNDIQPAAQVALYTCFPLPHNNCFIKKRELKQTHSELYMGYMVQLVP